jgi:hypothetical protein
MEGKWIIFWDKGAFSFRICDRPKQVVKETEKLIKFSRSGSWPRQIDKDDFIASFSSEAEATEALSKVKSAFDAAYLSMSPSVEAARKQHEAAVIARKTASVAAVKETLTPGR